jgi:biopolymer transport protein ExbB
MTAFAAPPTSRRISWLTFALLALLLLGLVAPAYSQDTAPENKDAAAATEAARQSLLMHLLVSIGPWFGAILFVISVTLVALVVLLFMDLRLSSNVPPGFVEDFTETVNQRKFKEAYELAREDGSYLGRVMATGMSRLQYGIEDAREAAFNTVESIKASKEQLTAYLATIGTLGPLLGLVGTVWGMIKSFRVMSQGRAATPAELASGISHALVVTLVGIALSVPAIFFHAFFKGRLTRIANDSANIADDLLTQMYHNSKKAAPAPVAAAADNRPVSVQPIKK